MVNLYNYLLLKFYQSNLYQKLAYIRMKRKFEKTRDNYLNDTLTYLNKL